MGHDPKNHPDEARPSAPDVKPKHYWEHTPSRRARPQYDPVEVAKRYLDDMERGGRLHNKRKND
jgi:hypothetical protein